MSSTDYTNGSFLTPSFVNTFYNTNGGHLHDGINADGHAPLINLATNTTGLLPASFIGFPGGLSGSGNIYLEGGFTTDTTTVPIIWQELGNFVSLTITTTIEAISNSDQMLIYPGDMTSITGWSNLVNGYRFPVILRNSSEYTPGTMAWTPGNNPPSFICATLAGNYYSTTGFTNSGTKGIAAQTIQFYL